MIYKFFADTTLDVDAIEKKMLFTRGYWNFKQVELNYSGESEKASEEIYEQLYGKIYAERGEHNE